MKLKEVVEKLNLRVLCGGQHLDREVTGGYSGDLLSDVIGNSKGGNVWVTMQVHVNIVAVAVLKELAAVIIVQGRSVAEDTLHKAQEENVTILASELPAFETAGRLNRLGVGVT